MNPFILRSMIYPAYRFAKRDRVMGFASEFARTERLGRTEILEYQWFKLNRLLEHACSTVPYYSEAFERAGITPADIRSPDDLRRLPVLTKDVIRDDLERLVSTAIPRERIRKDSTGGSTGEPTWYYVDDNSSQARQAIVLRGNAWCGARLGDRLATLWGAAFDLNPHQKLKGRLKSAIMNKLFLCSYNLNSETMAEYAETLQKFRPKLLTSYPTPLVTFAEFLRTNPEYSVRPGAIIASSETLFDEQREIIERTYGCEVFNRYGSREFGNIAHECDAHEGLHVNVERFFIEYLKEDGTPAGPGEIGEMLITDLDNFGMPFVRYRIDDLAVPSDRECSCGRHLPMIERVEGRVFDVIVTRSGSRFPGTFWTLLSRAVPGISKFQIVQSEPSSVVFRIVPNAEFKDEYLDKLAETIAEQTRGDLEVSFDLVDSIPLTRAGKHRFIVGIGSASGVSPADE